MAVVRPEEGECRCDPAVGHEYEEVGDQLLGTDGGSEGGVDQLHQTISSAGVIEVH